MTYYYRYHQKRYEWTAYKEADLLASNDTNLSCGDSFKMPGCATVTMATYDDDSILSGDEYCDDNASDWSGQDAYVNGGRVGAQLYAEQYHVLRGTDGRIYYLIEIEVEGYDAPGKGDDFFTFYGAVPPAGVTLTVVQTCNVSGCMIDYACLGAGCVAPPNTPPTFSNAPGNCITIDENTTFVIDLDATDADGDALSYAVVGGADAALFTIDAATGQLGFIAPPDYEAPADAGGDNTYEVQVRVADGKGGEEVKLLKVCVQDVAEGGSGSCTVIEAEDMSLCGYKVEGRSDASDGAGIMLCAGSGYATTTFQGGTGSYDLTLTYLDESDGRGAIDVYVNGSKVKTIWLNENGGGDGGVGSSSWSSVTIEDLSLKAGDKITLKGYGDCGEFARIDKIEICQPACEPCVVIEAEDMCAYNFVTVRGAEASGGELVRLACGTWGALSTSFKGCDGTYDLRVFAQDENDGQSTLVIRINGQEVGTILLDGDTDGSGDDNGPFTAFKIENLTVHNGDKIEIYACGDDGEFVRIDKIQLCQDEEPVLGALGDTVWYDADRDGLQDAGELGAAGVTVTLLNGDGSATGRSTVTDADGKYLFDGLEAGQYRVQFDGVAGYDFTTADAGDDALDSDADPATGLSHIVDLGAGETDLTVDAGLVTKLGALGDTVWYDTDRDGLQDAGELGAAGVLVTLLNGDGSATGRSTVTDADGKYLFDGLEAGQYRVLFDEVAGFDFTTADAGDDALDSDADPATGLSHIVDLGAGETDLTIDAGLIEENRTPEPQDDVGRGCADTVIVVDVLGNDSDPDGDTLTITEIDGQAISEGQTVSTAAGDVTLEGGVLKVLGNANAAIAALDIGEHAKAGFTYTVSDGNGGTASATVEMTYCGDANSLQSLIDSLPETATYQVIAGNEVSPIQDYGYDLLITGTGDDRLDGVVFQQAYCLSFQTAVATDGSFATAPELAGNIESGEDGSAFGATQVGLANGLAAAENLDLINWIIAQDFEANPTGSVDGKFSGWEVQLAIWELTDTLDPGVWGTDSVSDFVLGLDPAYGQSADVDFLVQQALANGEGFVAGDGDIASFIVDPDPVTPENAQPFIVAFNFDQNDCLC
ncbi:hypothetical protein BV509_13255 [Rhodovulum sulfidophilum]|uniref:Carboxypeptidase regulatory-like domain-containing protein n=1 Tax=Rhodovulum visakhapatnamense TaxID=364297 RepID=A0ABS1RHG5_9RHOB|nr:SdrD B-like domain-containing protein [Rhodovulum visakhapatnamense]MBL3569802.1 carboxypeptidase regulatory-like domain-containing protein [Rhodovulum visakhapatnamense]MBL3579112.1 carboxypeptidase regulatory-like domain-containing protein [Rhodovulum visakhapatnamense]OLS45212.1 hypothetical protein BV509_13255 [Rhodovulum sulfidophilum]